MLHIMREKTSNKSMKLKKTNIYSREMKRFVTRMNKKIFIYRAQCNRFHVSIESVMAFFVYSVFLQLLLCLRQFHFQAKHMKILGCKQTKAIFRDSIQSFMQALWRSIQRARTIRSTCGYALYGRVALFVHSFPPLNRSLSVSLKMMCV